MFCDQKRFNYSGAMHYENHSIDTVQITPQQHGGSNARPPPDTTSQLIKMAKHNERARVNQSRYRQRQRDYLLNLEKSNAELRKEIDGLIQVQQGGSSRDGGSGDPWGIVAKVFSFVQTSFQNPGMLSDSVGLSLMKSLLVKLKFAPDIVMGSVSGVGGLMQQLRRYATYFLYPAIHLERVEAVTLGVFKATAALTVTISAATLRIVFPHLYEDRCNTDAQVLLGKRLLGQRLTCRCSMSFVFDEVSSRVVCLEVNADWVRTLLRLLGSMEDVVNVLGGALMTHEGVLGTSSETREDGRF